MGPRRCTGASGAWLPQVPQACLGRPSLCHGRPSRTLGALVTTDVATSSACGLAASQPRSGVVARGQRAARFHERRRRGERWCRRSGMAPCSDGEHAGNCGVGALLRQARQP